MCVVPASPLLIKTKGTMEGIIHILNAFGQEYWIDGALVDKVTIGKYDLRINGKDAYVYYKKKEN